MKGFKEWGSRRRIDFLTPNTFRRKIIIVSTTANSEGTETAVAQMDAVNYFDFSKFQEIGKEWIVLARYETWKQAMKFHEKYCNLLKFTDAEVVKNG